MIDRGVPREQLERLLPGRNYRQIIEKMRDVRAKARLAAAAPLVDTDEKPLVTADEEPEPLVDTDEEPLVITWHPPSREDRAKVHPVVVVGFASQCQFPLWEFGQRPRVPTFCGHKSIENSSYCEEHHMRCHDIRC